MSRNGSDGEFSGRVTEASVSEARKISCNSVEAEEYTLEAVLVTGDLYARSRCSGLKMTVLMNENISFFNKLV